MTKATSRSDKTALRDEVRSRRVRQFGSARDELREWRLQRLTALAVFPLSLYFAASALSLATSDRKAAADWLSLPVLAFVILVVLARITHSLIGGDCHTPRNMMFATKSGRQYAGAVVDGWKAYNITPDSETGIGAWSDAEIEQYLSSGHAPARGSAGGGMAEAIDLSLRHLSSEDVVALTRYLRTVPPQRSELAARIDQNPGTLNGATAWSSGADRDESTGFQVFASACASCHGWDGNGQQTDNAGLRGSRSVNDPAGTNVVRAVLEGIKIGSFGGNNTMPPFVDAYSDEEIAAVSNYVIRHFGGRRGRVTAADVRASRD